MKVGGTRMGVAKNSVLAVLARVRQRMLALSRGQKRLLQVLVDVWLLWIALWLALLVRLGLDAGMGFRLWDYRLGFLLAPVVAIPVFVRLGLYRAVLRFFGIHAQAQVLKAVTLATLGLVFLLWLLGTAAPRAIPRSAILNYWCFSLLLVGGLRVLMRAFFVGDLERGLRHWHSEREQPAVAAGAHGPAVAREQYSTRVAVWGAGAAGNQLVAALRTGRAMQPVAFVDDDPTLEGQVVAGLPIYAADQVACMLKETAAQEVLLAIPSASRTRRKEVLEQLQQFPVQVRSIPAILDLANGHLKVSDIQAVDIADLLGRDAVPPREDLFARCIKDQVVLVTGAGGSIGSELCRQIVGSGATTLILFEHSEYNLYSIQMELEQRIHRQGLAVTLVPILSSIRNPRRLLAVMRAWNVDTVYHAAAYKHVPMVEHNMVEGVLNNVMGTLYTAQAAIQGGVSNFVLISTDKAVRPTNVMGGTKRLAEMVLQALSQETMPVLFDAEAVLPSSVIVFPLPKTPVPNRTRFTMVRFGNVLGSSGSVIPLFRQQIAQGGPVTVTHPNITRFFMTIPEAAQLVIQAGSLGQGGDVFVLDMGEPVKIAELAQKIIRLSGLTVCSAENPKGDIEIEFTGLRPGEKLYEELLIGENVTATEHSKIMRANEEFVPWDEFKAVLEQLLLAVQAKDYPRMRQILQATVSGYRASGDIVDWLYLQQQRNRVQQEAGDAPR
ncbi:NDP-sugar epimerase, includes UDP-GlcNAc-inverting 4,6-dehydratase FlaA1 and capsular polysaccharide biosynthesis protein EpsC [Lampropedia hyalina DSM 16112]|jgi:FlaA1/EpsC-like NDP-sugar epimerase|uniref:NDP-sugar epimerase, includes UDP-GlcNAc-inverting 4,6-dehydratase FlaA1 and capsular polysaccharide biosynthesis protein EpsC n=1 Tax=Lampropedia hyalina DSM 16112 TaxID=1122156 RepID=A0A1M5APT4_9BURK|nr:NDP-sugar epimerase, includes UDP-GlcNAc-inverting 4,6-dehydratase FlaA1 and capsular polysaccharide biosynthesis protein EpsC [Lampropedia hyalina DSM 16112]